MDERWKLAAVSITGSSHAMEGSACEDSCFVDQADNGFVVGVVSDGAGSALFGGQAARLICEHFRTFFGNISAYDTADVPTLGLGVPEVERHWTRISRDVKATLHAAREGLCLAAETEQAQPSDFLATTIGAIAHPHLGAIIFHIGDGAATVFGLDGTELYTSQPENGEYLNQTYFLIEDHWRDHLRESRIALPFGELFLMTDGVTDLAYVRNGRTLVPEERFFRPLSVFLDGRDREAGESALVRTLDSEAARERVDDDKTLVWIKSIDRARAD